jgi:hypothetical protein
MSLIKLGDAIINFDAVASISISGEDANLIATVVYKQPSPETSLVREEYTGALAKSIKAALDSLPLQDVLR